MTIAATSFAIFIIAISLPTAFAQALTVSAVDALCDKAMRTWFTTHSVQIADLRRTLEWAQSRHWDAQHWATVERYAREILHSSRTTAEQLCANAALELATQRLTEIRDAQQRAAAEREAERQRQAQAQRKLEEDQWQQLLESRRSKPLTPNELAEFQPFISAARKNGPGDLRIWMTWDEAIRTEFIRSSSVVMADSFREIPFRAAEQGGICLGALRGKLDIISCDNQRTIPFARLGEFDFDLKLKQTLFGESRLVTIAILASRVAFIKIEMHSSFRQLTLRDEVLRSLYMRYGDFIAPSVKELQYFKEGRISCIGYVNQQRNIILVVRGSAITDMIITGGGERLELLYSIMPIERLMAKGDMPCLPAAVTGKQERQL